VLAVFNFGGWPGRTLPALLFWCYAPW